MLVAIILLISILESLCTVVPYLKKVRDIYKNLVREFAICSKTVKWGLAWLYNVDAWIQTETPPGSLLKIW